MENELKAANTTASSGDTQNTLRESITSSGGGGSSSKQDLNLTLISKSKAFRVKSNKKRSKESDHPDQQELDSDVEYVLGKTSTTQKSLFTSGTPFTPFRISEEDKESWFAT